MSEDERHEHFLREAVRLARESVSSGGGPFGAVVVRGGEIIASGTNRVTSDSDPTAHAEVVAIRSACEALSSFQLENCDVYSSTEPCPMCMAALYWARPNRVFFASGREDAAKAGFDDQFIYDELARATDARDLDMRRVAVEEAGSEFAEWDACEGRTEY
ncbi:MAG: nucleoside deaminase [Gemmatimonadota bacterium]|nr:nucleoside deaminase [Gemmatimonadota bacterium]